MKVKHYKIEIYRICAKALLLIIVYAKSFSAQGQNVDTQLWSAAILDMNLSNQWLAELEIDYNKLLSEGEVWREFATQPSVEYYPNNSIDLFAGVYITSTKQNNVEDTDEIRPMAGFRWNIIKPEKRVFLRSQFKYEHRFFKSRTTKINENVSRIRLRLDLFIPITKHSYNEDNDLYGKIWSEVFINFDNTIGEKYQSIFRQYLGLGYRFSFNWRLETDYVFQASRDAITDDHPDTLSSVLFITLKHYLSKR